MQKVSFYYIENSTELKVVGNYPQIIDYEERKKINSNSISNDEFAKYKGRNCDFTPNLDTYILHSKAKLTDYVSCALCPGGDMLISKKFSSLINKHKFAGIQVFNSSVKQLSEAPITFDLIHFNYCLEDKINFFLTEYNYNIYPELKNGSIKDYPEYLNFRKIIDKRGMLRATKLVLNSDFDTTLDFFVLSWLDQRIYISEKLKNSLAESKITGVEIKQNYLFVE